MYAPQLGRFISRDPVGYVGGENLYQYVRSQPINYVDPFGLADSLPDEPAIQYFQQFLKSHGIPADPWVKNNLAPVFRRGCVGITRINLGLSDPMKYPDVSHCYDTPEHAEAFLKSCDCAGKKNSSGGASKPRMYSIHFWSTDPYTPDPMTGQIDMSNWDPHAARPPENATTFFNFDYAWHDTDSDLWIHANTGSTEPPGTGFPFKVIRSNLADWQKSYRDFNKEVFCVACEDWQFPQKGPPKYFKSPADK